MSFLKTFAKHWELRLGEWQDELMDERVFKGWTEWRESGVITKRVAMTVVLTGDSGMWDKRQARREGSEGLPELVIDWIWGKTSVPWDFEPGWQGVRTLPRNIEVRKRMWWPQIRQVGFEVPVKPPPPQNAPPETGSEERWAREEDSLELWRAKRQSLGEAWLE